MKLPKMIFAARLGLACFVVLTGCASAPRSNVETSMSVSGYTDPVTGVDFVWVPKGCFMMGAPRSQKGRKYDEVPQHEVCVDGFWMSKYEVTNAQYRRFRPDHDSKTYHGESLNGDTQPAVSISWEDATAFASWLSNQGNGRYRLPSEAEWEYAARAGSRTARFWGETPNQACEYANVNDKTFSRTNIHNHACNDGYYATAPVGSFKPNAFGLYDIYGNAFEGTLDWYDEDFYYLGLKDNPVNSAGGQYHAYRGGCFDSRPDSIRSAYRTGGNDDFASFALGIRLVREK